MTMIIGHVKEIGMNMTTPCEEPRKATEVQYLSANTIELGGVYVPVWDRNKLMVSLIYSEKHLDDVVLTLQRVAGILLVGWTDPFVRRLCREIIEFLDEHAADALENDPAWKAVKCSVKCDRFYYELFTGRNRPVVSIPTQGRLEALERLESQYKSYRVILMNESSNRKTITARYPNLTKFAQRNQGGAKEREAFRKITTGVGAGSNSFKSPGKPRPTGRPSGKGSMGRNQNDRQRSNAGFQSGPRRAGSEAQRLSKSSRFSLGEKVDGVLIPRMNNVNRVKYTIDNEPHESSLRHSSLKSYLSATAPLTEAVQWYGASSHEFEYNDKGMRALRVGGRELLGDVQIVPNNETSGSLNIGERLPGGVYPLSPHALGSRLGLYADLYEEHEFKSLRIRYEPSVPTITPGAIAMYFRNDVGSTTFNKGRSELAQASTHPSFVQTPVYEAVTMEIKPEDINIAYMDESVGDLRLEAQGMLILEAASALTASSTLNTLGELYIEYDCIFKGAELEYQVVETQIVRADFIRNGTTAVITAGNPFEAEVTVNGTLLGTNPGIHISGTGLQPEDMAEYIFSFVTTNYTTTGSVLDTITLTTRAETNEITPFGVDEGGRCMWGRVSKRPAVAYMSMSFFDNLAAASEPNLDETAGPNGQLINKYSYAANAIAGKKAVQGRMWKIIPTTAT
jgi:hypothetical protein